MFVCLFVYSGDIIVVCLSSNQNCSDEISQFDGVSHGVNLHSINRSIVRTMV